MLDQVAEHLEKRFPSIEFRMVELGPNVFNFIYEGRKELSEPVKNPCPSNAVAPEIAKEVCAVSGHSIASLSNGQQVGPQGIVPMAITVCTKCGIGLNEIREGVDRAFNMAVAEGVKQAVAALHPPPVPGAGGPFPVPNVQQAGGPPFPVADKPVAEPV
jgi:hypothetical protein